MAKKTPIKLKSTVKVSDVINLGQLLLKFSRVERSTFHEDGSRPETDSDHSIMLSVLGCAIADRLRPDLDIGKIAQYALIHDLVEVYAGDTITVRISEEEKQAKNKREAEALARIIKEFGKSFPWLANTTTSYEALDTIEARFVKGLDKLMPEITHILNNGKYIRQINMTQEELITGYDKQISEMKKYSHDLPEVIKLKNEIAEVFIEIMSLNNKF